METVDLTIIPGAPIRECRDCACLLLDMYTAWARRMGMKVDVAVNSLAITITGENVREKLQREIGVHRILRVSPFDERKRRHTSFSSVFINGAGTPISATPGEPIRSYVFEPYRTARDHRTDKETTDLNALFAGDLDLIAA